MYKIIIDKALTRKLSVMRKRPRPVVVMLEKFLNELGQLEDPRSRGKPLSANLAGLWRYRIGDYRLFCDIQDDKLIVVAFEFEHRSKAYDLKSLSKYLRYKRR